MKVVLLFIAFTSLTKNQMVPSQAFTNYLLIMLTILDLFVLPMVTLIRFSLVITRLSRKMTLRQKLFLLVEKNASRLLSEDEFLSMQMKTF
jgi:hypothetical protein